MILPFFQIFSTSTDLSTIVIPSASSEQALSDAKDLQEMGEKTRFFTALRSVLNDKISFSYTFKENKRFSYREV
jgi:hypothetical protein